MEHQKSKNFNFLETSFKAVLRAPKRSQHLPRLLRLSLGTPRTPMSQMKEGKILLENSDFFVIFSIMPVLTLISASFTHLGDSKIPISWGDAGAPNAPETDVRT